MSDDGASTSAQPPMNNGGAVNGGQQPAKKTNKPKYTKFTQQELPACKPLLTPGLVISIFMIVGVIFIPIGAVTLVASNSVVEIVHSYEKECLSNLTTKEERVSFIQDNTKPKACNINLQVSKKMKAPVYIYYQLDHFYQNHRRYVKSRDDEQLRSDSISPTSSAPSACKPQATYNGKPIVPCGLIAWSLFNDSYIFQTQGSNIFVNRKGISWKSDRDEKFGKVKPMNFPNNNGGVNTSAIGGKALDTNLGLNEDEDLIVWMRTAALPTFRKLWGKIEQDLEKDQNITVTVQNNYNSYTYGGGKKLVLSTTSWLGGKNDFLGIAYLTTGILCMFLALVFFVLHWTNPRPLGDPSYLSWNKNKPPVSSSSSPQ